VIGLIVSPFVVAILAAWIVSRFPRRAGLLAAWPGLLAVLLGNELWKAASGGGRLVELPWAPSLGLSLSFNLDGLGLLFATLITGVGALVVLYASRYLEGHAQASRFYASLFAFMGAMLEARRPRADERLRRSVWPARVPQTPSTPSLARNRRAPRTLEICA
jgi:NADH:ubiquinone oxidoreductase subunit 5 (subunit L)/multisubunit Na+/H+ antiporter MnhA subunit